MNIYNVNDKEFTNSEEFQNFLKNNPAIGNLKIRAYAASGAVPIKGLKVVISTDINDNTKVIFFEGTTNESGVIEKISLPVPRINLDNMMAPNTKVYDLETTYDVGNVKALYKVNMYDNIYVVQNINVVPDLKVGGF